MKIKNIGPIQYFGNGTSPKLLIRSGTHGDEYEVVDALKAVVKKRLNELPDFVFIPEVSPSAVLRRTRANERGIDLNRSFVDGASDPETLANMEISSKYHFDLCLDFHEDLKAAGFYMYDSGVIEDKKLASFKEKILGLGVGFFSGIDDPDDPALAIEVIDGYVPNSLEEMGPQSGMFEIWAMRHGLLKRCLVLEIPGKLSFEKKKDPVELIFDEFIVIPDKV